MNPQTQPLEYAHRAEPAGDPLLRRMVNRRWATCWCGCGAMVGLFIWPPIGAVAMVPTLIAVVMTLVAMTEYASANLGRAYAVRHLALAIALSPLCLVGVFLVSHLVEADTERWHLDTQSHR